MKLRIRGNSIRLRLTQSEVARIGGGERVEEILAFGTEPRQQLIYALEVAADAASLEADYSDGRLTVRIPSPQAREWANNQDSISISSEQILQTGGHAQSTLKLLIEKDFACLTERRGTDDADTFPHPMQGALRC